MCGGDKNVIGLVFCQRIKGDVVLAMPYVKPVKFGEVVPDLTYAQMIAYMKNLFIALAHVHSRGIIHRDVKPANFLFDFHANEFRLVDFGLAQHVPELTVPVEAKSPPPGPSCKKKFTSKDFDEEDSWSSESPEKSPARKRLRLILAERNEQHQQPK